MSFLSALGLSGGDALAIAGIGASLLGSKSNSKQIKQANALSEKELEFRKELATAPITDALGNRQSYSKGEGFKTTLAPNQQTLAKSQEAENLATGPGGLNTRLFQNAQLQRRGTNYNAIADALASRIGRPSELGASDIFRINTAENASRNNAAFDELQRIMAINGARTGSRVPDDTIQRAQAIAASQPSFVDAVKTALALRDAQDAGLLNNVGAVEQLAAGGFIPFNYSPPPLVNGSAQSRALGTQLPGQSFTPVPSIGNDVGRALTGISELLRSREGGVGGGSSIFRINNTTPDPFGAFGNSNPFLNPDSRFFENTIIKPNS